MPRIRHKRVAVTADDPAADVKMSDWNDDHVIRTCRTLWFQPLPASTSFTGATLGGAPVAGGTATARTPAATGLFAMMHRVGLVSSASAANRSSLHFSASSFWRGNAPGLGGFYATFRFGFSDAATVATANAFAGMASSSSMGNGGTEPSVALNLVGVGCDSGETTLSIMHNDGSGTANKISLGANFPANTNNVDAYELVLSAEPNGSEINYQLTRLNTGDTASGSLTTNIPAPGQIIFPLFMRGNMSTALAVGLDIMGLSVETEV